jgi:phosphatidylglycerol:prolipoprotein diacylglycerol transferase
MLIHPQFDPVALQWGPLAIHWYGLTYLVAFGLFLVLTRWRLKHAPYALKPQVWHPTAVEDLLFYGVLGVVLGGVWAMSCFTNQITSCSIPWRCLPSGKGA